MSKREWLRMPSMRVALGALGVAVVVNVWVLARALRVPPVPDAPTTTVASLESIGQRSPRATTKIQSVVEDDLFSPERTAPSTPYRMPGETAVSDKPVVEPMKPTVLGTAVATYKIALFRRGRYEFGPMKISTRFPLGLVRGQMTLAAPATMIVAPRLGRLLPSWAQMLEAEQVGDERRHPHRGLNEGDYYGLRPWQRGDSLRWVHWRTTAKLSRPMVKQFERRRGRD